MESSNTIYFDGATTKKVKRATEKVATAETTEITKVSVEAGDKLKLPRLGMVGFTTKYAVNIHMVRKKLQTPCKYSIAMDSCCYENELIQSDSPDQSIFYDPDLAESVRQLYCDDFHVAQSEVRRILCHEARNLYVKEGFDVLTLANPGFDFALETLSEELNCKVISLSRLIVDYCWGQRNKLKKIGVFGTPLDIHPEGPLMRELTSWAKPVTLSLNLARQIAFGIEKKVALRALKDGRRLLFSDYALALANAMQDEHQLDAMIICNPELHDTALQLRRECGNLEVIDATEMSWQLINQYFDETKASAEAEPKET